MQLDPKDLGWIGMLKSLINAGIVCGAIGLVASAPEEFNTVARVLAAGAAAVPLCMLCEWLFRAWHQERADAVRRGEAAVEAAIREGIAEGIADAQRSAAHATARGDGLDKCLTVANARLKTAERPTVALNGSSNLPDSHGLTAEERAMVKL